MANREKRAAGFILFPDDVLSSSKMALMTDAEFRTYVLLWCHCWNLDCTLPGTLSDLERLCHGVVTPLIRGCFIEHPEKPGFLTHPKLWRQLVYRKQSKVSGTVGALSRWDRVKDRVEHASSKPPSIHHPDVSDVLEEHPPPLQAKEGGLSLRIEEGKRKTKTRHGMTEEECEATWRTWNFEVAPRLGAGAGVPKINGLSDARQRKLQLRLAEYPNLWELVIQESKSLGEFAREKKFIDFDWLMSPDNLEKFLEGKYRRKDLVGKNAMEATS